MYSLVHYESYLKSKTDGVSLSISKDTLKQSKKCQKRATKELTRTIKLFAIMDLEKFQYLSKKSKVKRKTCLGVEQIWRWSWKRCATNLNVILKWVKNTFSIDKQLRLKKTIWSSMKHKWIFTWNRWHLF